MKYSPVSMRKRHRLQPGDLPAAQLRPWELELIVRDTYLLENYVY